MAERERFYERRWARTAVTAVGLLALAGCNMSRGHGGYTNPHELITSGYSDFGELDCGLPNPSPLTGQYDFSDRAVRALVIRVKYGDLTDSMRVKLLGPNSSVLATHQGSAQVDIDKGVLGHDPVVIDDILPGVRMTAVVEPNSEKVVSVTAECA